MKRVTILAAFVSLAAPVSGGIVLGGGRPPEEPDIVELTYADVALVDQYLTVFTGGAGGFPGMDSAHQAMIFHALCKGDYDLAAQRAWEFVKAKALARVTGGTLGAFLTAVSLGERLGISAHAWAGQGRLASEMERLENLCGLTPWPRSYREALANDFFMTADAQIRPISLWLRDRAGGAHAPMSYQYYDLLAYQLMLALWDLELGYRRFGLEGEDRTLENLERALREDLRQAAIQARNEHEASRMWAGVMQAVEALDEARREATRLRHAEEDAKAMEERRRLAEERERAEQAAAEAAAEAESALERLERFQEQLPEPDESAIAQGGEQGPLSWTVAPRLDGPERTLFTISLTNLSDLPLRNLRIRHRRLGPAGPGGTGAAWSRDQSLLPGGGARFTAFIDGAPRQMQIELFNESGTLASLLLDALHGVPVARTEPDPLVDAAPAATAASDRLIDILAEGAGHQTPVGPYGMTGQRLTVLRNQGYTELTHFSRLTGFKANGAARPPQVWGTDVYSIDSSISAAAVHSGVLEPGQQGEAWILVFVNQPQRFAGSTQHGIVSEGRESGRSGGQGSGARSSFRFVIKTGPCRDCPADVEKWFPGIWRAPGATRCIWCMDRLGDRLVDF